MASKTLLLMLANIVILLMVSNTLSEMNQLSKDKVNSGINSGQKVVEFISKLGDPKVSKVFDALGKMSSFLGAVGGLISFILLFIPRAESAELKFMKSKFAEVNQKLDIITSELDNVKGLVTYENQRSVYLGSATKILFGVEQLSAFLNELEKTPCSDKKNCKRVKTRIASRYVKHFDVKQDMFKILHGAIKPTSAFGDPLLDVMKKTFKCDVGKIDHLANSILKLSFKAQQVILAHEKLTGSKHSITQSMFDWLHTMYAVRDHASSTKKQCFSKIYSYMLRDVKDKKYQVGVSSNKQANQEVKAFMEKKYKWLGWVAHSYGAYGGSKHCVVNIYAGVFVYMPKGQNNRKRNLIVTFSDKSGTYSTQKKAVLKALDYIVAKAKFVSAVQLDACKLLPEIERMLRERGVLKYITSLSVLRSYSGFNIAADNDLAYISKTYTFEYYYQGGWNRRYYKKDRVHIVIVLKSMEIVNGVTCDKPCKNQGSCAILPYSSKKYCQCKPYYQGENCEEHAKALLAKTMDAMLETTLKLPMLSDIMYEIEDLREYIGISFGEMQTAISNLEAAFQKAFDDLSRKITRQFQWSNLITLYNNAIRQIEFYTYRFKELPKRLPRIRNIEAKKLATAVLEADGIEKWLYELNFLFIGRSGAPLVRHDPLLLVLMKRYHSQACTPAYKAAVDYTWRQLVLLQQMGFVVYAQALEIMSRPTEYSAQLYKTRAALQATVLEQKTCEYSIPNSVNVQCSGGRYLHPGITIINQCETNYHITGRNETTCIKKASGCACSCFAAGSNGTGCADLSGQCECKSGFYGKKCANRDCVWSSWSDYASTHRGADYARGYVFTRERTHKITKVGHGQSCIGPSRSYEFSPPIHDLYPV